MTVRDEAHNSEVHEIRQITNEYDLKIEIQLPHLLIILAKIGAKSFVHCLLESNCCRKRRVWPGKAFSRLEKKNLIMEIRTMTINCRAST